MLPATISTSVAPETINKVTRLFNGSVTDILHELLQNARRAGASMVAVSTIGRAGDRLLHLVDDGHGIADPASIVTLGRSGWNDAIARREDPAGMGVFSLAGRDVIIRSWSQAHRQGWCAHIPAAAWESSRQIAISPDPIGRGTAISIRMDSAWEDEILPALSHVARHYPLPVTFDGESLEQTPWLDEAIYEERWNGCRIGVVKEHHRLGGAARLNFHGLTIPCRMPIVQQVGRGEEWTVLVDIIDCPAIQLVLPARKEVVQNDAVTALCEAARKAIYGAIARESAHRLSHKDWLEARRLGVTLPEAECRLHGWCAPHAARGESYMTGSGFSDATMIIMPDVAAILAQPAELAIQQHKPFSGPLVFDEPAFAGYRWYDGLARVQTLGFTIEQEGRTFHITDENGAPSDVDNGYVEQLTLEATIVHRGATKTVTCGADVAFAPDFDLSTEVDDVAIFVRLGAEPPARNVISLLQRAAFEPSSDSCADSYETQEERFRRDASDRVLALLEGTDAALEAHVRALFRDYPVDVPADRSVTITMTLAGVSVTIAERRPEVG